MNEENEKRIKEHFPFMRNIPFSPTLGVRDGWFNTVWHMCEKIETTLKSSPPGTAFEVLQLKEKFGLMRCYISTTNPKLNSIIDDAEHESERTCEVCGEPGKLRPNLSWIQTLCDKHYDEASGGKDENTTPLKRDIGWVSLRPA